MFGLETLTAKLIAGAVGFALLVSLATAGYFYVTNLQNEVKVAQGTINTQKGVIDADVAKIKQTQADLNEQKGIRADLQQKYDQAQADKDSLKAQLSAAKGPRSTKQLAQTAVTNPTLVENTINQMMAETYRCNEIVSGSPTETEDATNLTCPKIVGATK